MTPAELGAIVREFTAKAVADAVATLLERNAALELRILELETHPAPEALLLEVETRPTPPVTTLVGVKGDTGTGIASLVITADNRLLAHLTDGRSVDVGPLPAGPAGTPGLPGEKGEPGAPGVGMVGPQGPAGPAGLPGEKGADGIHGRDGQPGRDGVPGTQGEKGLDGKDGINGRDGVDGLHGKDGADGLGFDDFDLVLDESRGWVLRLSQGARVKEWVLGIPFDAKVWAAGKAYPVGAGVTWDGHYWIAQAATTDPPGDGSPSWRLAVRRGKEGRTGKQGNDGAPGRDLTQLGEDGRKW